MRRFARKTFTFTCVSITLLTAYNAFTFAAVAMGARMEYVWWLHFPLKFFIRMLDAT